MTAFGRAHVSLYRCFMRLMPRVHRVRHGDRQVQLFADLIETGHRPWRLWIAAIPDLASVVTSSSSRRAVLSDVSRVALVPLSVLNACAGLLLAGVAIASTSVPLWVAGPAMAVALQGGFTVVWLLGRVPLAESLSTTLFRTGEAVAFVVGGAGVVAVIIRQSQSGHPEYGPPTMLGLIAFHALIGLLASRRSATPGPLSASAQ